MQDINDRNCIYMQGVYGNSVSSAQFFYKPCCSVAKSPPTLCNPMKRIMPRFPALHNLLELVPTHVRRVGDAIQLSHPLFPLSSCPQFFPASESSPMSWFFTSCGQRIGDSASVLVFPMNIQGWIPLGLTGLISLLSKGFSRVFGAGTTVWKHQFFTVQHSLWSNSHVHK